MKTTISKSFLMGYARAINLAGIKEWPDISNDKTKDFKALRSDWNNVGEIVRRETGNYKSAGCRS